MTQVWFRYVDVRYAAPLDEYGHPIGEGSLKVELRELPVIKKTPKGVWLIGDYGNRRFVRYNATKTYACPTKDEAKASFIARKRRQIKIYSTRLRAANAALDIIQEKEPLL